MTHTVNNTEAIDSFADSFIPFDKNIEPMATMAERLKRTAIS